MNETNILSVGQLYRKIKTAQEKGNTIDERRAWASLLENKSIQGSSTEFHNLSVTFYQDDDYITALEIVDKGLETYGSDKDLLGDALLYSLCIGNLEKAKEIYQRINNFPQSSWSWRCFAYSIRYVMDTKEASRTDEETSRLLDEALKLSLSYQNYFSNICNLQKYSFFSPLPRKRQFLPLMHKKYHLFLPFDCKNSLLYPNYPDG